MTDSLAKVVIPHSRFLECQERRRRLAAELMPGDRPPPIHGDAVPEGSRNRPSTDSERKPMLTMKIALPRVHMAERCSVRPPSGHGSGGREAWLQTGHGSNKSVPPGHPLDLVSEFEAERERAESIHAPDGVIQVPKQAAPDVVALPDADPSRRRVDGVDARSDRRLLMNVCVPQ
jgi:hypothetical protein